MPRANAMLNRRTIDSVITLSGIHFFHVKLNAMHVPGSPFKLKVGQDESDPAAVGATGPGLKDVVSGGFL
jgi:hypothetical protein